MGLAADAADLFEELFLTTSGQNGTQQRRKHQEAFPDRSKRQTRAANRVFAYVYGMAGIKCWLWVVLMRWNHWFFYIVLLDKWCLLLMFRVKQIQFMEYKQYPCFVFVLAYVVGTEFLDRMQNTEVRTKHNTSDNHQKQEQVKTNRMRCDFSTCLSSVEPRSYCIYYFP